jgi:hypothetical protein
VFSGTIRVSSTAVAAFDAFVALFYTGPFRLIEHFADVFQKASNTRR